MAEENITGAGVASAPTENTCESLAERMHGLYLECQGVFAPGNSEECCRTRPGDETEARFDAMLCDFFLGRTAEALRQREKYVHLVKGKDVLCNMTDREFSREIDEIVGALGPAGFVTMEKEVRGVEAAYGKGQLPMCFSLLEKLDRLCGENGIPAIGEYDDYRLMVRYNEEHSETEKSWNHGMSWEEVKKKYGYC